MRRICVYQAQSFSYSFSVALKLFPANRVMFSAQSPIQKYDLCDQKMF